MRMPRVANVTMKKKIEGRGCDRHRCASDIRADLGFTFGDACVSLDGYPIPILPPSGVMQIAAYEAINAEVHARRAP